MDFGGQTGAPIPDLAQEQVVKLFGPDPGRADLEPHVELAAVDGLTRKEPPQLVEPGDVFIAIDD